jgi:polysaccharide pyruvyl transferase WcaK-like protein
MKEQIKSVLFNSILLLSRLICTISMKIKQRAIVLVPSWEGSLGDEAVIDSITCQLQSQGFYVTLLHFGKNKEWNHLSNIDKWFSISTYFSEGGWLTHLKLIFLIRKNSHFYTLGTDMMDGCYAPWLTTGLIKITNQAASSGLITTLVGFSINEVQDPNTMHLLSKMNPKVRLCIRDKYSLERFTKVIPERTPILTADIAFLLRPRTDDLSEYVSSIEHWIIRNKKENKAIIGINISPQLFNNSAKNDELLFSLEQALVQLKGKHGKLCYILVPHDFRIKNSDIELLKRLYERLTSTFTDDILFIDKPIMASEIKSLIKSVDIVISGRMHLAIACLSSCVPVGCIVYQGKFEGLFDHFSLTTSFLLQPEMSLNPNYLVQFVDKLLEDRLDIIQVIKNNLDTVKKKALANI